MSQRLQETELNPRSVLVLAAHPDDEVLGCGGSLARLSQGGASVHVAFLADGVLARGDASRTALESRRNAARRAGEILGIASLSFGDFPDNRMDTVPLLDVIQSIEATIREHQ